MRNQYYAEALKEAESVPVINKADGVTADIGDVRTVLELSVVLESLCGDLKRFHARIKAEGVRLHVFA